MDQYSDIKIVECNRLHSEEAKGNNNENYSLWTNNLQDILMLNPKDQVSVYGAFISERGAGQSSSIEIKGTDLGEKHLYSYVNVSKTIATGDRTDFNLPSRCSKMIAEDKEEELALRDDELKFVMNYYIPASARNSLHLPRRWMYSYLTIPRKNFTEVDNAENQGATLTEPIKSNYSLINLLWNPNAFYQTLVYSGRSLMKPKNDNSRYTIMIRDKTFYTDNSLGLLGTDDLPEDDLRDPENAIYRTFRELKTITIPSGFNSPDFIATEVSRQFQNIINDEILIQRNTPEDPYPQPVSKILESETYKAFYSGNIDDNTKNNFLYYFNLHGTGSSAGDKIYRSGHTNASGYEWLRQYGFVACKYPELYETGRRINVNSSSYLGIKGAEVKTTIDLTTITKDTPIELDIDYNKINVDLFKAFFDAQKLYPEIITDLNLEYSGYNAGNTINNTRWIHINRYSYNKQSLSNPPSADKTQLGWGGYYFPRSWTPTGLTQLISLLLLLYYDPQQAETYYENPDINLDQFTYGCIGKSSAGNILIYPFKHETNGIGSPPIEELRLTPNTIAGQIEATRKIGFDMHFNAPGMYYLMPLSGWTNTDDPTSSYSTDISIMNVPDDLLNGSTSAPGYLLAPWKKLLYIGADNPSLNWDGTNFSFSYFHTSKNRGNKYGSQKGVYQPTLIPRDDNAGDEVYEINPPDLYNDFTPDRTPYSFDDYKTYPPAPALGTTEYTVIKTNQNYMPYQIYDQLCGIMIEDFGVPENLWSNSLWGLLGFTYKQLHGKNNRQVRIQRGNANDLSVLTTNAEVVEGDTKIFMTNWASVPMYSNMINTPVTVKGWNASQVFIGYNKVLPQIIHRTQSIQIIADNLPTRMIRGYYTIRSNILEGTPFIGGKVNNTTMPIIGVVDKINGDGDFYFGQESSLTFTITKPIRLASLTIGIHDPDGSYARTSEQSTILFKIQKPVITTFNIAEEILQQAQGKKNPKM